MKKQLYSIFGLVVMMASAHAEDKSLRVTLIRVKTKDAPNIYSEMNDVTKGAKKLEIVDKVIRQNGVVEIARFDRANPWPSENLELTKVTGKLGLAGPSRDLEIKVGLEGWKVGATVDCQISSFMELPSTRRSYRGFSNSGHRGKLSMGQWEEATRWEDGDESISLWYFVTGAVPLSTETLDSPEANTEEMRIEIRWLKATERDLAQMNLSGPETRGKAVQWLLKRAVQWKAGMFVAQAGERITWSTNSGKLVVEEGQDVSEEEGIYLEGSWEGREKEMEMNFKVSIRKRGSGEELIENLSGEVIEGKWGFSVLEDVPDANLVAYRFVRK